MIRSIFILLVCAQTSYGLFQNVSAIYDLNNQGFENWAGTVNRRHASVVLFYNSNSALSKDYAETYTDAALQASNWHRFTKFHAYDCIQNEQLCQVYGFEGSPHIKYFSANTAASNLGEQIRTHSDSTSLLTEIVKKVTIDYTNKKCPYCPSLRMFPADIKTLEDVWNFVVVEGHYRGQQLLIPVENENDPNGVTRLVQVEREVKAKRYFFNHLPVWRIPKNHNLIRSAYTNLQQHELIMLTRTSDTNLFQHGDGTDGSYRFLDQIPVEPATRDSQKCCTSHYSDNANEMLMSIVRNLPEYNQYKRIETLEYGSITVQHYF